MKKILSILALLLVFLYGCEEAQTKDRTEQAEAKAKDPYTVFNNDPKLRKAIVYAETRDMALTMQKYNLANPNIDTIIIKELVITGGGENSCRGYLVTEWHIKDDYFSENKKEFFVEVTDIAIYKKDYITWSSKWPEKNPFINY